MAVGRRYHVWLQGLTNPCTVGFYCTILLTTTTLTTNNNVYTVSVFEHYFAGSTQHRTVLRQRLLLLGRMDHSHRFGPRNNQSAREVRTTRRRSRQAYRLWCKATTGNDKAKIEEKNTLLPVSVAAVVLKPLQLKPESIIILL